MNLLPYRREIVIEMEMDFLYFKDHMKQTTNILAANIDLQCYIRQYSQPFLIFTRLYDGRGSSVGIAIGYKLDGLWSKPNGARFSVPLQKDPAIYPASCTEGLGYLSRLKWLGYCVYHPPLSNVEVAEVLELHILRRHPEHARPRMIFIITRLNKSQHTNTEKRDLHRLK